MLLVLSLLVIIVAGHKGNFWAGEFVVEAGVHLVVFLNNNPNGVFVLKEILHSLPV